MTTKEMTDLLRQGAAADIWYDAHKFDTPQDEANAQLIADVQLAMGEAADMIEAMCQLVGLIQ